MATTKEELIGYIRTWVSADSELKRMRTEMKRLNQEKKSLLTMIWFLKKHCGIIGVKWHEL